MMFPVRFVAAAALMVALALPLDSARAQVPLPMPGAHPPMLNQVELSDADIENFISVYPRLTALGEKHGYQVDGESLSNNPAQAFAAMRKSQAVFAEMHALLADHGFSDMQQWMRIAYSIALAHGWRDRGGENPMQNLDKTIAEIRANPQMSEQQRSALIAQLEAQRGLIAAFQPSEENIQRVKRYEDQLTGILDR